MIMCTGCRTDEPDTHHAPGEEEQVDAGHGHGAHEGDTAHEPMALRPIMQRLSAHMGAFMQSLWVEDYDHMAESANGIAEHPHISDEELARIEEELGDETGLFMDADEAVHEASLRLRAAVDTRDMDAILERLHDVQVGCMSCHTRFRERLRTDQVAP